MKGSISPQDSFGSSGSSSDDNGPQARPSRTLSSVTGSVSTSRRAILAFARTSSGHEKSSSSFQVPPSGGSFRANSSSDLSSLVLLSSPPSSLSTTSTSSSLVQDDRADTSDDGSSDGDADFGFTRVPSSRTRGSPLLVSPTSPSQTKPFPRGGIILDSSSPTALIPPMPSSSQFENAEWRFELKSSELCIDQTLNPVAVYVIDVIHQGAVWEIVRRFSQFYELDMQLRYQFHKSSLPRLPRKYLFKSGTDPLLIKERTALLQKYISELGADPQVSNSDSWREWVMDENPQHLLRLTQPILSGLLLRKRAMRPSRRCFFVLTRELLVFYEGERPKSMLEPPSKILMLDGASLKETKDQKVFIVTGKNSTSWTLEASHTEEASAWKSLIQSSIKNLSDSKGSQPIWPPRISARPVDPTSRKVDKDNWETGVVSKEMKSVLSFSHRHSGKFPVRDDSADSASTVGTKNANAESSPASKSSDAKSPVGAATPTSAIHGKSPSFNPDGVKPRCSSQTDDVIMVRARSDSLPTVLPGANGIDFNPGESLRDFIEKQREKKLSDSSSIPPVLDENEQTPKRLTASAVSVSTVALPASSDMQVFQELPSRPRGATMMIPAANVRLRNRLEDRKMAVIQRIRQQKESVDKDLRYILKSLQSLEVLQSKSKNSNGQQSAVTSQFIVLIEAVLAATPEQLLESTLCKDTIMKIRQLDKHPMTSKLLFSLSPLARLVDAHKSVAPVVQAPPVTVVPTLPLPPISAQSSRTDSPSPRSFPSSSSSASSSSPQLSTAAEPVEPKAAAEEAPQARQPLGEIHAEPVSGPPNPRPERRVRHAREPRSSPRSHPKSLRTNAKKVMCRICEDEYPQSVLKEHTKYCLNAAKADMKDQRCDARIVNMLKLLEEHRQRMSPKGAMKEAYSKVVTLSANVCALQYGVNVEDRQHDCLDMLSKLQSLLVELTYEDIGLVTYLRRLISIIEEKWGNMKEFARLQKESEKDRKKPVNLWSLLSIIRPHMQQNPQNAAPDELLLHTKSRVSIDDFEIIKRISSGAYGKVYLARKKKTRDLFAVKVQNKSDLLRKNMADNVVAERRILSNVKTPFVVKLFYAFQSEKALFLVMEYCPGGDVATLLHNLGAFDMDMARVYAAETVLSLESLHKMSYIHRDLKPDNLLVNAKGHLLLTDFGLSSIGAIEEQSQSPSTTARKDVASPPHKPMSPSSMSALKSTIQSDMPRIVGTPDYLAPEMLLGTGHGPEVDWWALGIMIYEFLTGVPPFNAETPEDIFDRILRRDLIWPEDMDPSARDIINKLLNPDASQRLGHNGAAEVKAHPFFEGINWDTLLDESREDIFVPQLDNPEDTSYHEDHRQSKGGSSINTAEVFSGQDFQGFEFTNAESLGERTLLLADDDDDDDDDERTEGAAEDAAADESEPTSPNSSGPNNAQSSKS